MRDTPPIRVLFVDDDPDMLRLYRAMAEEPTVEVLTTDTAAQAVHLVKTCVVDIVVTDLHMPGRDGISLLRELRTFAADLPVLLVTLEPTLESAELAVEMHATRYLRKPINGLVLRSAIASAARSRPDRHRRPQRQSNDLG